MWFCCKEHRQIELLRMSQEAGFLRDFERCIKRNSAYTVTTGQHPRASAVQQQQQ